MVICAVVGCSNRTDRDNEFSFFRFPGIKNNVSLSRQELQKERRRLWILRINRRDFGDTQANYSRVCSNHFVLGKPCSLQDKDNPDWAPSLNLGYQDEKNIHATVTKYKSQKKIAAQRDPGLVTQKEIEISADSNLGNLLLNHFETEEENVFEKENEPEDTLPDLSVMKTSDNEMLISDELMTSDTTIIKQENDSYDENDDSISGNNIESKEKTILPQNKEMEQKTVAVKSSSTPERASANYYFILPPSSTIIIRGCSGIQSSSTGQITLNNPTLSSTSRIHLLPANHLPRNLLPDNQLTLPTAFDLNYTAVKNSILIKNAEMQATATQVRKCTRAIGIQVNLNDTEAIQDGKIMYCSAECSKKIKKMKREA